MPGLFYCRKAKRQKWRKWQKVEDVLDVNQTKSVVAKANLLE